METEEELIVEVLAEIEEVKYLTLSHGKRSTYSAGCRGPLCRKAERDRGLPRMREVKGIEREGIPDTPARRHDALLEALLAS